MFFLKFCSGISQSQILFHEGDWCRAWCPLMLARIRPHGCKVRGLHQQQLTWHRHWLRLQWVVVPWGLFFSLARRKIFFERFLRSQASGWRRSLRRSFLEILKKSSQNSFTNFTAIQWTKDSQARPGISGTFCLWRSLATLVSRQWVCRP